MNFLFRAVHQSSVFLSFVLGIIFGTILSLVFRISFFDSILWLAVVLILLFYAFLKPSRLFIVILFLAGSLLANFRVALELKNQSRVQTLVGETMEIVGEVKSDPGLSGNFTTAKLKYKDAYIYAYFYAPKTFEIKRGDFLTLKGKISDGFGTYSASMFRPELLRGSRPEGNYLIELRDSFAENVRSSLSEDEASLGLAYLLGLRNGLSEEIVGILAIVGLTHIVVASGTHLSIIVEFVKKIFGRLSRFSGLFFSILFILAFAELIGWTASITRAAIVSILSLSAWYVGKKFDPLRIILISMSITLLIDPMNLTNLGWLLSFGSFSGILLLGPILTRLFYGKTKPKKIPEILLATISATLMTAPILLYYFGSLSIISLVANLLILPTIPFAMGLTFLTGLAGFLPNLGIFNILSVIVVKITTITLDYHLLVMRFFGAQTMFLIKTEPNNPLFFLLYLPILSPLVILEIKKFRKSRRTPRRIPNYFNS